MNAKNKSELKALLQATMQTKVAPAKEVKQEKPVPQNCDAGVHAKIVEYARIEESIGKAEGKRYPAFKAMLTLALPLMADAGQWAAIAVDVHQCLKARNLSSVGVQLVGIINNARKVAYGAPATRDKASEPAQGANVVLEAMDAATSLKTLKTALAALKVEKHASQGVSKAGAVASAPKAAQTAKGEEVKPASRAQAIQVAIKLLKDISASYLKAGTDSDLLLEIADVCEKLKAKAA